jgi:histidinol-phosphate aminotransferase
MKMTRRGFVGTLGLGAAAGLLTKSALDRRTVYAAPEGVTPEARVYDGGIMQLNQNESARGPGPKTMQALHTHITPRIGRGYSPDHVNELQAAIADYYGLQTSNVLLGTGSTPLLQGSVRAFCSADKGFVTAGPTYSTSEQTARTIGAPVQVIQVDKNMSLDLDAMAAASVGAGLVYICNPNNPTGTVHSPAAIEGFVRRVLGDSPNTRIHIDEAYINYADPAVMQTALPLVKEFENVFITRSFSKAHGMAGLRVGYALGHASTIDAMDAAWGMGEVNMLGAIAALTAFNDHEHIAWERQENTQIRAFTVGAFRDMGYEVADSHVNHIFVNVRRPASEFRAACLEHKISVGRDFPPFEKTHARISLGSREEMQIAVAAFRKILA